MDQAGVTTIPTTDYKRRYSDLALLALIVIAAFGAAWLAAIGPRAVTLPAGTPFILLSHADFYPPERFPDGQEFRWGQPDSVLQIPYPGGTPLLRMTALGSPGNTSTTTLRFNGWPVHIVIPPERRVYTFLLPPQSAERITLQISAPGVEVNKRFLGLAISTIRVWGGDTTPISVPLALALAGIGMYAFLRWNSLRPILSGAIPVASISIVALFYAQVGWRYGLVTPIGLLVGIAMLAAVAYEYSTANNLMAGGRWAELVRALLAWFIVVVWIIGARVLQDEWRFGEIGLSLTIAMIGMYLLLRYSRIGPLPALAVVLFLQAGALIWKASGVWHYNLLTAGLLLAGIASLGVVALERRDSHTLPLIDPQATLAPGEWKIIGLILLAALAIRLPFLAAPDPVGDLELAARRMEMLYNEGLAGAYTGGGDYMPLRLYILYAFSQLVLPLGGSFAGPLPPVTMVLIKLPGILADLATAALLYWWGRRWQSPRKAAMIAMIYTLAIPIWLNSAWWGQVDTLLMLPLLGTVLLLDRAEGRWSWVCWAMALLIKTQAIILAPLLYLVTARRHGARAILGGGGLAAGVLLAGAAPLLVAGQVSGIAAAYLGSVGRFPRVSSGAYNLWYLMGASRLHDGTAFIGGVSYRLAGLLLLAGLTLVVVIALIRHHDSLNSLDAAAVLALGFFLLPTQIHERYLFLALAFVAAGIPADPRRVVLFLILALSAALNIIGDLSGFVRPLAFIIRASALPAILALINLAALAWLTVALYKAPEQ